MKIVDPFSNWSEPAALKDWGAECSPPFERASLAYLNNYIHPDIVVASGRLLFPAFVEHEGGVFLEARFNMTSYAKWKNQLGDITAVESMINHQHVYDLFATSEEITEYSFENVAKMIAQTLRWSLRVCFPERDFNINVSNTDQDYGPTVSFHSEK